MLVDELMSEVLFTLLAIVFVKLTKVAKIGLSWGINIPFLRCAAFAFMIALDEPLDTCRSYFSVFFWELTI